MARTNNPYGAADRAVNAIDRERERERRFMLKACYKYSDELSTKLVQRLLDDHIIETTSEQAVRELFIKLLTNISDMEEFDLQFKIAPIRSITNNPNIVSLFITQYITEDLIENPVIQDVFGDDLGIYNSVNSIMAKIRPTS